MIGGDVGSPSEQAAGGVNVLTQLPRDLARDEGDEGRIDRVGDHREAAGAELNETVGLTGALGVLLEQVEGAEVPVVALRVLQRLAADRVGVLEGLAVEVTRHVGVVEAHLPDQCEVAKNADLLLRRRGERDAAILQLLDVLQVPAGSQLSLGDVTGLVVQRVSVEGLEQQREQALIVRRLLLQDASGTQEQDRQRMADVLDVGGERVALAGQRGQLVVNVLQRELPVAAVVQGLLEAVLVLLVASLGAGGRLEVGPRIVDLTQVEQGPTVSVVEGRRAVGVLVGAQLECHQLDDHLEVRHLLVDGASLLQREEVLTVTLDGRLVERHRLGLVEEDALAGVSELEKRGGLRLGRAGGTGLRLEFVDDPVPLGDLGEP